MNDEYTALLANVLADPTCDVARLVMADWLEEHDDATNLYALRAAEIRFQVARPHIHVVCLCLAQTHPARCWSCRTFGLTDFPIPRRHDGETHDGETHYVVNRGFVLTHYVINRGFVCEVRHELTTLRKNLPEALAVAPITTVWPVDKNPADSGRGRFTWYGPHPMSRTESQSDENRLSGNMWSALTHIDYETRDSAMEALSQVLITEARRKVGVA